MYSFLYSYWHTAFRPQHLCDMSDRIYRRKLPIITLVLPVWREIRDPMSCIVKKPIHSGFSNNLLSLPLSHSCRFFYCQRRLYDRPRFGSRFSMATALGTWRNDMSILPIRTPLCQHMRQPLWLSLDVAKFVLSFSLLGEERAASIFKNIIFKLTRGHSCKRCTVMHSSGTYVDK